MSGGAAGSARLWLEVPYDEKDEAKAAGARWDPAERAWFAPRPGMGQLGRWAALPPVPWLLPGEDRAFGSGLFVDLVPASCWFTNVRSCVDPRDWDRLRRMVYGRAGDRCEACGSPAQRDQGIWLEAHERWDYDGPARVQRLRRLVCLCSRCHEATHYGRAEVTGNGDRALGQLLAVTGLPAEVLFAHIDGAFRLWQARSLIDWELDLSMLTAAGIRIAPPPDPAGRRASAEDHTAAVRQPEAPAAGPPPGWHPDPSGRYPSRWWDGTGWTAHVEAGGQAGTDPIPL